MFAGLQWYSGGTLSCVTSSRWRSWTLFNRLEQKLNSIDSFCEIHFPSFDRMTMWNVRWQVLSECKSSTRQARKVLTGLIRQSVLLCLWGQTSFLATDKTPPAQQWAAGEYGNALQGPAAVSADIIGYQVYTNLFLLSDMWNPRKIYSREWRWRSHNSYNENGLKSLCGIVSKGAICWVPSLS